MKRQLLFILGSIFITAGLASAQTAKKTVTNSDLEKFRQKRLQAERDLRENYARLGFPSPEEMERRRAEADAEREKLAEKLRQERLEREQIRLESEYLQAQQNEGSVVYVQNPATGLYYPQVYSSGAYYAYPNGRNFYFTRRHRRSNGVFLPGGGFFGPTFNPRQGVQINTTPIRINTVGPTRRPVRIRSPR
ncbi:MAG: hypothetical protein R2747_23400 [Pyrinomonadaceae bacterium]